MTIGQGNSWDPSEPPEQERFDCRFCCYNTTLKMRVVRHEAGCPKNPANKNHLCHRCGTVMSPVIDKQRNSCKWLCMACGRERSKRYRAAHREEHHRRNAEYQKTDRGRAFQRERNRRWRERKRQGMLPVTPTSTGSPVVGRLGLTQEERWLKQEERRLRQEERRLRNKLQDLRKASKARLQAIRAGSTPV